MRNAYIVFFALAGWADAVRSGLEGPHTLVGLAIGAVLGAFLYPVCERIRTRNW